MGEWEEIFGEGVDAETVIDEIDRGNRRAEREEAREREQALEEMARSRPSDIHGTRTFPSFREALAWAKANPGQAITRISGSEGFMVKPSEGKARKPEPTASAAPPAATRESLLSSAAPAGPMFPLGQWVLMDLPRVLGDKRFLGFVYFDREAGLSAMGGAEGDPSAAERPIIVRLPQPGFIAALEPQEAAARGLPTTPSWLQHYGPQPDPNAQWRSDPALAGRFHPSFPDAVEVIVHNGEPRRTGYKLELCWVQILGVAEMPPIGPDAPVYRGQLRCGPFQTDGLHEGDELLFVAATGGQHPLAVTRQYLDERKDWTIEPCKGCGLRECLDPPSVMMRTRFPDLQAGATTGLFSSFCTFCGGIQVLKLRTQMPTPAEELRAKWVEEMDDFKLMTWAAQRGYKLSSDGHPDSYDMDLYDQEAKECERLGAVLGGVVLPPNATPDEARELARNALKWHRAPANDEGGRLARQYTWAQAVVEGDAKKHWNSYHPRWVRPR
jgi:hypothetical protein